MNGKVGASFYISQEIDVIENSILLYDRSILRVLLSDKNTGKNILWATTDYAELGPGYEEFSEITADLITGEHTLLIQPRISKSQNEQEGRTRNKAEVFTPSGICNKQNNLVDEQWFRRSNVFNIERETAWIATEGPVSFEGARNGWQKYVDAQRLEISCGEAPYLVSRYDTVTGERIPINSRIGLLDRKMRVVNENTETDEEWLSWSQRAVESVYGYEYQGDNLLLARENLFYTYIDYYRARFSTDPDKKLLRKIALIIAWNIWQMDGLKYVVPGSCHDEETTELRLDMDGLKYVVPDSCHDEDTVFRQDYEGVIEVRTSAPCPGCAKNDITKHNGIYCRIMDWRFKTSRTYISMTRRG